MSEGVSGHPTPLGCVCGGTSWQMTGLMRGVGNSWVTPAVPTARSNRGKPHITGSWRVPATSGVQTGHSVCWEEHQQQGIGLSTASATGCGTCWERHQQFMWQFMQEELEILPFFGLLPALLTCRLRLQPPWSPNLAGGSASPPSSLRSPGHQKGLLGSALSLLEA